MYKKSKKIACLLIVFVFLLSSVPFSNINLFSDTGLKTSTSANFYAISESDETTRWILQNASLTSIEDFHDDINTDYWNLIDVSANFFTKTVADYLLDNSSITDIFVYTTTHFDVGAQDSSPRGITWDGSNFWIVGSSTDEVYKYTSAGVYTTTHFDVGAQDSNPIDITWDGSNFWIVGSSTDEVYKYTRAGVYTGTHFDVGAQDVSPRGITWDGSNFWIVGGSTDEVYKYTSAGVYTTTHFDVGAQDSNPYGIVWDGSNFWMVGDNNDEVYKYTSAGVYTGTHFDVGAQDIYLRGIGWDGSNFWMVGDNNDEVYKYEPKYNIFKNYFGSGYMYMQTDTTELISLKSVDYGTHKTLNSGDYFEVDFQTNSDSQINLILLKDGGVNKTLTLSQSGNSNFNRHTAQISVDESVEFDQLKISSTFEDEDYIKVYDIKTFKYTLTGDYADLYVSSNNQRVVNLSSDIYNLRIFDPWNGDVKINENITIGTDDYNYVYTPTESLECRLTLSDTEGGYLEFTDYHISINRSLNGEWYIFDLLDNIFTADVGSHVYINVSDRFDTLIDDEFDELVGSYIELELKVYQFQIKNLMTKQTILNINSSLFIHPLLSGDSIYFTLSEAYYTIQYYDTNDVERTFTIFLDSNQAYELNRSQICFLSYTDEQANHLFFEDYMTYLNGSLIYEKVFYEEIGTDVHINITDRYDINLYIGTYTVLASDNYIPIILEVYELKLKNMQNEFNNIIIERSPFPIVGTVGDIVESGHFPATYSFKDDFGLSGVDIPFIESLTGTCTAEILSEYDGHKNVLKWGGAFGDSMKPFEFAHQIIGNIEFWTGLESGTRNQFLIRKGGTLVGVIVVHTSTIRCYYGDGAGGFTFNNGFYDAGKLAHVKVYWDCNTDKISYWVNGDLIVNVENFYSDIDVDYVDNFYGHTNTADSYNIIDAIGYSWENYNIGDNLHDSYYLGYEPFEAYNQTIEGYYIGTESFDYNTEEGVYYGTWDYRDEVDGTTNDNIDGIDYYGGSDSTYSATIMASEDGHKKVIKFLASGDNGANAEWRHIITAQTTGILECWYKYIDHGVGSLDLQLLNEEGSMVMLGRFDSTGNRFYVYHAVASTWVVANADTWYHIKITWDCGTDTYSVWLNGVNVITDLNFYQNRVATSINYYRTLLQSGAGANSLEGYVDAFGEDWDTTSHGGLGYKTTWNFNAWDLEPILEEFVEINVDYDTYIRINPYLDGHINSLGLYDNSNTELVQIGTIFPIQTINTIEWYQYVTDATKRMQFLFRDSEEVSLIALRLVTEEYLSIDGDTNPVASTILDDTWYHHRIDYDCTLDTFDWYVNGVLELDDTPFLNNGDGIERIVIMGYGTSSGYNMFFDALGVVGVNGYEEGDNTNSHGHDVIDELEARGLSFNKYVLNSIGISGEFNSHKKFINMTDGSSVKGDSVISETFSEESGTIEFYFKHTTTTKISYFILRTPVWPDVIGTIRIDGNGFIKWAGDVQTSLQSYSVDTWYHVRIDFECGSGGYMGLAPDTVDIYIDGVLKGDNLNFDTPTTTFYQFYLSTHTTGFGYSVYFDAIAVSWISGYYVGDNRNFYDVESEYSWTTNIAPDEVVSFRLLKGFYNIWMVNSEETISYSFRMFDDNYFVLNRSQMCFLSYTNVHGDYLDFRNYNTTINGTIIYEHVFYENIGVDVNITVKDFYNTTLATQIYTVLFGDNYIPLVLDIYELKIKNEATEVVDYTLLNIDTGVSRSGILFSDEIVEFSVALGDYSLDYINHEDMYPREYNFTLIDHKTISINSTYHTVYFSLFTYDGLGVDPDLVRFYINDKRKDFGFNVIQSETAELVVLDFFNNTLANDTIDASAYTEWNIFVEIYSLIILNQFTYEDIVVNITQVGSGMWMTQIIPKQFGLTYRFLPNVEYNITIYFTNATFYDSRIVNLTSNSHIESFGVATTVPEYPKDVYFGVYTTTGLGVAHDLLRFYIEGNRSDFGFNRIEDMIVSLVVKDFFNTTLFNQMINTSGIYEYDILITLYSLKVKNEARVATNYTLKLGGLDTTGFILPDEIIEYQLATNNYVLDYTNNEDSSFHTISIDLNRDRVYILNSTYYDVYIGLYNFYGLVNKEEVKFYINNTRADFGFNTIKSEYVGLLVLDYFNSTLYSQTVRLEGLEEYSVFIQAYTLVVNNLYNTQPITIKMTRGNITVERLIEAQGWTEFKLYPNIVYDITSYVNGTKDEEKEVELDEEYKTVDFGFYEEEISLDPLVNWIENIIIVVFAFLGIILILVGLVLFLESKLKKSKKKNSTHKLKATSFDRSLVGGR